MQHIKVVHLNIREYKCRICDTKFSNKPNLLEHIGIKHMGYKDGKEWRKPENVEARKSAAFHEAFEHCPDKEWRALYKQTNSKQTN